MAPKRRSVVRTTRRVVKETVEVEVIGSEPSPQDAELVGTTVSKEVVTEERQTREVQNVRRIPVESQGDEEVETQPPSKQVRSRRVPVESQGDEEDETQPPEEDDVGAVKEREGREQKEEAVREKEIREVEQEEPQPEEDEREREVVGKETEEEGKKRKGGEMEEEGERRGKAKKGKRGRRRPTTPAGSGRFEGYKRYVHKLMKQIHPELEISEKAMTVVNNFVGDMFERLAEEAARMSRYAEKMTLTSREIQGAVRLVLPGELGKHAAAEGAKAISNYLSYPKG